MVDLGRLDRRGVANVDSTAPPCLPSLGRGPPYPDPLPTFARELLRQQAAILTLVAQDEGSRLAESRPMRGAYPMLFSTLSFIAGLAYDTGECFLGARSTPDRSSRSIWGDDSGICSRHGSDVQRVRQR